MPPRRKRPLWNSIGKGNSLMANWPKAWEYPATKPTPCSSGITLPRTLLTREEFDQQVSSLRKFLGQ